MEVRDHVESSNVDSPNFISDVSTVNERNNVSRSVSDGHDQAGSFCVVVEAEAEKRVNSIAHRWNMVALEEKLWHHWNIVFLRIDNQSLERSLTWSAVVWIDDRLSDYNWVVHASLRVDSQVFENVIEDLLLRDKNAKSTLHGALHSKFTWRK